MKTWLSMVLCRIGLHAWEYDGDESRWYYPAVSEGLSWYERCACCGKSRRMAR